LVLRHDRPLTETSEYKEYLFILIQLVATIVHCKINRIHTNVFNSKHTIEEGTLGLTSSCTALSIEILCGALVLGRVKFSLYFLIFATIFSASSSAENKETRIFYKLLETTLLLVLQL
jgi:hypothetical protein